MNVKEAAEKWGITPSAVRKLIGRGRIESTLEIIGGKATRIIPDDHERPEKLKCGVKPKSKDKVEG